MAKAKAKTKPKTRKPVTSKASNPVTAALRDQLNAAKRFEQAAVALVASRNRLALAMTASGKQASVARVPQIVNYASDALAAAAGGYDLGLVDAITRDQAELQRA